MMCLGPNVIHVWPRCFILWKNARLKALFYARVGSTWCTRVNVYTWKVVVNLYKFSQCDDTGEINSIDVLRPNLNHLLPRCYIFWENPRLNASFYARVGSMYTCKCGHVYTGHKPSPILSYGEIRLMWLNRRNRLIWYA